MNPLTSAWTPAPAWMDNDYQPPFRFTGKLDKLTIKLAEPKQTAEDRKLLEQKTQEARNAAQ